MTGTRSPSPYQVFMKLARFNSISTITVGELLNLKQFAIHGKNFSKCYVEQWTNVLKCASQAVIYHKEQHTKYTPKEVNDGVDVYPPLY